MDLAVSSRSPEQVNALAARQFDDSQLVQVRSLRPDGRPATLGRRDGRRHWADGQTDRWHWDDGRATLG